MFTGTVLLMLATACCQKSTVSNTIYGTWSISYQGEELQMVISRNLLSGSLVTRLSDEGFSTPTSAAACSLRLRPDGKILILAPHLGEFQLEYTKEGEGISLYYLGEHDRFMGAAMEKIGILRPKKSGPNSPGKTPQG
jgi:hypothetical protein